MYQLAEEYRAFAELIDDDGEVPPDVGAALDRLDGAVATKIDNTIRLWANMDAEAEALRAEAARLGKRAKSIEERSGALREWVRAGMCRLGTDRLRTGTHTLSVQKNPPAVVLDVDPAFVPEEYCLLYTSPSPRD